MRTTPTHTPLPALGAALGLLGALTLPRLAGGEGDELATIAVAPTRFLVGNLLTFLACALIGAGLVVIAHRLRVNHRVAAALTAAAALGVAPAHERHRPQRRLL